MNPWTHLMPSGRLAFVQMKHFMVTLLDTPLMFLTYPKVQSSCVACHGDLSLGDDLRKSLRETSGLWRPQHHLSASVSLLCYGPDSSSWGCTRTGQEPSDSLHTSQQDHSALRVLAGPSVRTPRSHLGQLALVETVSCQSF